jgi:hypothetical protein
MRAVLDVRGYPKSISVEKEATFLVCDGNSVGF